MTDKLLNLIVPLLAPLAALLAADAPAQAPDIAPDGPIALQYHGADQAFTNNILREW